MDNNCAHCSSFQETNKGAATKDELDLLFHQPCSHCSLSTPSDESLCPSCQHLRFRHLMTCVKLKSSRKFMFPLKKGLSVEGGIKCPLCRLLNQTISKAFNPAQFSDLEKTHSTIVLDLALSRDKEPEESCISSAEVYSHYNDSGDSAMTWVATIHISDINHAVPTIGEMVSWTHLKDMMAECYNNHKGCQPKTKDGLPQGFRVIDIVQRRIVEMNECRFVALSYVWGLDLRPSLLMATCATIEEMKEDGALCASDMPQTIEDAMKVCAQLGERYLWADRLCIIQDDAGDKENQIDAMGDIYSSAHLVLAITHGDSMDFGIPGIGHAREVVQHHEDISGLRVTNLTREIEGDSLAVWHTRGWTYQEAVLAKRRLYFTNVRAFFECGQLICHEDQHNSEKLRNELTSDGLWVSEEGSRFDAFVRHLKHYTSRSLKYTSDAYNAFTGISKSLYDRRGDFLNGLPQADFDRALRWYADVGYSVTTRLEQDGIILPTWSWSSVMSHPETVTYQATTLYGTLVPWYKSDTSFSPGVLEAFNIHSETAMDDDWQVYMAIACSQGCVANLSFPMQVETTSFSIVREKFNTRWQSYHTFFKEAIDIVPVTVERDQKPGVIFTKTQTALLRLEKSSRWSFGLDIVDSGGAIIGALCGEVTQLRREVTSPQHDKDTLFEFIALSLSGKRIDEHMNEEPKTKDYFDVDGNSLARLPIVNVLMITWFGSYARRSELGWIYLVDWVRAHREWKVVRLE